MFTYVNEHMDDIKALIYLTDGRANDFPPEQNYHTLWMIYGGYKAFSPGMGEVCHVD